MAFGKKLSRGFRNFGKKAKHDLNKFGKKGGALDLGERKFFNSIDSITPALALGADLFAPGAGEQIYKANDGLQDVHKSIRKGVGQIQQIGKLKGDARKEAIVNFGDNIGDVRREVNRSNTLLRDAGNAVRAPQPAPQPFF
jgi:hypothetical protein